MTIPFSDALELGFSTNLWKYSNIGYQVETNYFPPIETFVTKALEADVNIHQERYHKHTITHSLLIFAKKQKFWTFDLAASHMKSVLEKESYVSINGQEKLTKDTNSLKLGIGGATWHQSRFFSKLGFGIEIFQLDAERQFLFNPTNSERIYFTRDPGDPGIAPYLELTAGWII